MKRKSKFHRIIEIKPNYRYDEFKYDSKKNRKKKRESGLNVFLGSKISSIRNYNESYNNLETRTKDAKINDSYQDQIQNYTPEVNPEINPEINLAEQISYQFCKTE